MPPLFHFTGKKSPDTQKSKSAADWTEIIFIPESTLPDTQK